MIDADAGPTESLLLDEREEMLKRLISVMEATHRVRRIRRRAVAVAGGTALVGFFLIIGRSWLLDPGRAGLAKSGAPSSANISRIIETDPTTLRRFAARRTGRAEYIDDRTLTRVLLSIDRPADIVHDGDRIRLSAPVTNEELGI